MSFESNFNLPKPSVPSAKPVVQNTKGDEEALPKVGVRTPEPGTSKTVASASTDAASRAVAQAAQTNAMVMIQKAQPPRFDLAALSAQAGTLSPSTLKGLTSGKFETLADRAEGGVRREGLKLSDSAFGSLTEAVTYNLANMDDYRIS
ncbi:MAG: hypothetical protein K2X66_09565 [Cyanobacteria bacterium]|nr:hypothetical protein [Cyanobacteriota bacterium]